MTEEEYMGQGESEEKQDVDVKVVRFRFRIGEFVKHLQAGKLREARAAAVEKQSPERYMAARLAEEELLSVPTPLLVVERKYVECYGGTQNHYLCRADLGPLREFAEIELELADAI